MDKCLTFLLGALSVALLWVFWATSCIRVWAVKALIRGMKDHDKLQIYSYVQELVGKKHGENDDSASSCWSYVSECLSQDYPNAKGQGPTSSCNDLYASDAHVSGNVCQHLHTTRSGTNAFQKRVRCKDCKAILSVERIGQKHATRAGK